MSRTQWVVVAATILIVLPVVIALTFLPQLWVVYMRTFELPGWEAKYGFRHGRVPVVIAGETRELFGIRSVTPGGLFAEAAVPTGGGIAGFQHGFEAGFYGEMISLDRGETVTLSFWLPNGEGKKVTIHPEAKAAAAPPPVADVFHAAILAHMNRPDGAPRGSFVVVSSPTLRDCDVSEDQFSAPGCFQWAVIASLKIVAERGDVPAGLVAPFLAANRQSFPVVLPDTDTMRVVPAEEIDEALRGDGWWRSFYEQFPGSAGFIELSSPGFDPDREEALLYLSNPSGAMSGSGWFMRLSKTEDGWIVVSAERVWIS